MQARGEREMQPGEQVDVLTCVCGTVLQGGVRVGPAEPRLVHQNTWSWDKVQPQVAREMTILRISCKTCSQASFGRWYPRLYRPRY